MNMVVDIVLDKLIRQDIEITPLSTDLMCKTEELLPKGHMGPCVLRRVGNKLISTCECVVVSNGENIVYTYNPIPELSDIRLNKINHTNEPFYNNFRRNRNKHGSKRW